MVHSRLVNSPLKHTKTDAADFDLPCWHILSYAVYVRRTDYGRVCCCSKADNENRYWIKSDLLTIGFILEQNFEGVEITMKKDVHPEYVNTKIRCACGSEIEAGSTKTNISVEICSKCHPFFTGKQKLVDTAGRIERFRKKYEKFQTPDKST